MGLTKTEIFTDEQNRLAVMLKAMAHPARIAILQQIIKANTCICGDLADELGLAQPTISQHLKELKNALAEMGIHDVLIKLYTSGINPSDVKKRRGIREQMSFPRIIPHSDGAGIIVDVGSHVSRDRIGQCVIQRIRPPNIIESGH